MAAPWGDACASPATRATRTRARFAREMMEEFARASFAGRRGDEARARGRGAVETVRAEIAARTRARFFKAKLDENERALTERRALSRFAQTKEGNDGVESLAVPAQAFPSLGGEAAEGGRERSVSVARGGGQGEGTEEEDERRETFARGIRGWVGWVVVRASGTSRWIGVWSRTRRR